MKIKTNNPSVEMSEAFITSAILAVSGGFQDAYTYYTRDHVFSNAQTGNIVLMSQNFMNGKWMLGIRYLFPLFAFILGVFVADRIQYHFKSDRKIHWRQGVLLLEIVILFAVGFMPEGYNIFATTLVSFTCAMQVQTFRKVNGFSYASTMCIGNLRSGTAAFSSYFNDRDKSKLKQTAYYYGVIAFFALGAGLGGVMSGYFGFETIWVSCVLLLTTFFLLFIEKI